MMMRKSGSQVTFQVPADTRSFYKNYMDFYHDPFIKSIAVLPKWTISNDQKVPLAFREFVRTGKIYGAFKPFEDRTACLKEVIHTFPYADNHTFWLDCQEDGFMVLDIESSCSEEMKQTLLSSPYIYGERSKSGKGYHLVFPVPKNYHDFLLAENKVVLRSKDKTFEILMRHWVLFTRDKIPLCQNPQHTFEELYGALAEQAESQDYESNMKIPDAAADLSSIPLGSYLLDSMMKKNLYKKTVDDFHGDQSAYEWSVIEYFRNQLNELIKQPPLCFNAEQWTREQQQILVYQAVVRYLPHRSKHDEKRSGMPFLLYSVCRVFAQKK